MNFIFATIKNIAARSNTTKNTTRAKPTSAKRPRLDPLVLTASSTSSHNHVDLAEQVPLPRTRLVFDFWQPVQQKAEEMPSEVAPTAVARANKRCFDETIPAAVPAR